MASFVWMFTAGLWEDCGPAYLTDSVSSGLTAVVKQRHVGQTVAVVHMATTLQDLRQRQTKEREQILCSTI